MRQFQLARGSRDRILLVALLLTLPGGLVAQHETCRFQVCEPLPAPGAPPSWVPDALVLTLNAVTGGLTVGIARRARGDSFWRGFVQGAAGGGVAFAGKRIAAERFSGAGFLGREVAAVGTSMVANGSDGRPLFERLVFPVGLVRLHLDQTAATPVRVKVDLPGVLATGYVLLQPDYTLDWTSTLSAGAPVFLAHHRPGWAGLHAAGTVLLRAPHPLHPEPARLQQHLAHEQIHILQYDFSALAWSKPAERWLLEKAPAGAAIHRHLDVGLHLLPWGVLNLLIPYNQRPWELEAFLLVR